jgi:hypothetical protein
LEVFVMNSPFPGVDPYIESQHFWPDFHASFLLYWRNALRDLLPDHYEARIDEQVSLVETHPRRRAHRLDPDVAVTRGQQPGAGPAAPAQEGVAVLEPVTIPWALVDEHTERHLEILHRPDRTLVAVLELLSPANKEEPGFSAYRAKRNALVQQPVHLVNVDLLLLGNRLPLSAPLPRGDTYALVSRADRRPDCEVYAWTVRQPLPAIPIPLLAPDPDVRVDLGAVFAATYRRARYDRSLDYTAEPPHALAPADRDWARQQVRAARP